MKNLLPPPYGGVYVLVIGESQNRKHMSAYGYNRETTPWLDSMKNDDQFLLMKNAYANQVQTVPALSYALTAKNQYNQIELSSAWSLLEVAKAAGFDTVWLSNQAKYGVYDTPTTVIASEAEQQQWINDSTGESVETAYYDEKLLDAMDKIQLSNNMLIIIHLMGSHVDYNQRYPQNFEQYSSGSKIDKYDNSILYNDFVMKNIYERVKIIPNFKDLIYFSDHAEGIDQGLDHNPDYFVPDMTKIPMYMYLSDSYVQEHPQVLALLKTEQDYYFTNDLIYNTMLGIMNIKTGDFYEPQNDLTSGSYDNDYFRFKTLHGEKSIADIDKDN